MPVCWVKAGCCDHEVTIDAGKKDEGTVAFSLETTCPIIQKMHEQFRELDLQGELSRPMRDTTTYKMATHYLLCNGCPVPSAILKTAEVISGTHRPNGSVIKFLHF